MGTTAENISFFVRLMTEFVSSSFLCIRGIFCSESNANLDLNTKT